MNSNKSTLFVFIFFLISAQIFCFSSPNYSFAIESPDCSYRIVYPKNKKGLLELGEDSDACTPFSLVVCDGVGGYDYTTKFFSKVLANGYAVSILEMILKKKPDETDFFDFMGKQLNGKIVPSYLNFNSNIKSQIYKETGKTAQSLDLNAGSTFISAFLTEKDGKPYLAVIQKGDSVLRVFRTEKNPISHTASFSAH